MSKVDIEAILELEKKAAQGDWWEDSEEQLYVCAWENGCKKVVAYIDFETCGNWNQKFITSTRNNIKTLCLEVLEARKELEVLREVANAAKAFIVHGHPLPTGVCISDHYINKLCDCGFTSLENEIKKLDEVRKANERI